MDEHINKFETDLIQLRMSQDDISNDKIENMQQEIPKTFDNIRKYLNDKQEKMMKGLDMIRMYETKKTKKTTRNTANSDKSILYVIGDNLYGELPVGNTEDVECLVSLDIKNIVSIHPGSGFTIFIDSDDNYWASGSNMHGACTIIDNKDQTELTLINYFKRCNVKIKKVCTSCYAPSIFWITDKRRVYANGRNTQYQLGSDITAKTRNIEPILIKSIKHIIDIKPGCSWSIAICNNYGENREMMIISYWNRIQKADICYNIINLIIEYLCYNTVYSSGTSTNNDGSIHGAHGHGYTQCKDWKQIDSLKMMNIVQISIGVQHTLFLDSNGKLYGSGCNDSGQLGLGHLNPIEFPTIIKYFDENNIKIKNIDCCGSHNLAISIKNVIYSWGDNIYHQCGIIEQKSICNPSIISALKECEIVTIKCGAYHNYAYSKDGKHYLWGQNNYKQCLVDQGDDDERHVKEPYCINSILNENISGSFILKNIYLGNSNTLFTISKN